MAGPCDAHDDHEDHQSGRGDLPLNGVCIDQVSRADAEGRDADTDVAAGKAQEHLENADGPAFVQGSQRGRSGNAVIGIIDHGGAEGDQQEYTAGQGRVHEVLTQSAEEALGEEDREQRARERDIKRYRRRQAQGQQKAGDHCGQIPEGIGAVRNIIKHKLCSAGCYDAHQDDQQSVQAEMEHAEDRRRKQGKHYIVHFPAGIVRAPEMRR